VYAAAVAPDGQTLAWSLEDGSIQLIRVSDQQRVATLTGHPDYVYDLRFSPAATGFTRPRMTAWSGYGICRATWFHP